MSLSDAVSTETSTSAAVTLSSRPGVIFRRTLRDNVTGILSWGLGYSLLIGAVAFLYPVLKENNTLIGIATSLNLFGFSKENADIDPRAFTTFAGYLGILALNLAPHILSIYLIPQALNAVSREEERGTLDILLSTPTPRWRFLIEKTLASILSFLAILTIMWLTLIVSKSLVTEIDMSLANVTAGIWHIIPVSMVVLAATLLISVTVRTSRMAGSIIAFILLGNYFWRTVLNWVSLPFLTTLKPLSIFYYYRSVSVFSNGVNWSLDQPMLILAAVLFAAALWQFNRRDVGL